jgi:hypothetical protein
LDPSTSASTAISNLGLNLAITARDPLLGSHTKRMEREMVNSLLKFPEITGEAFDFKPELTSEPTTQAGRHILDCETTVYMQTRLLSGETDLGGFVIDGSTNPFPTETIRPTENLLDL